MNYNYPLFGILLAVACVCIYNLIANLRKNNAEFKRMRELTDMYCDMLDNIPSDMTALSTGYLCSDIELRYKKYMLDYKNLSIPGNGYSQFMDEFETKLFRIKVKLKKL